MNAKKPSDRSGLSARFRPHPLSRGTAASKIVLALLTPALLCALWVALAAPPALGAFARPALRQIGEAEGGIATDASDHLWVGFGTGRPLSAQLEEFSSAAAGNARITGVPIEAFTIPQSIAIENASGRFYVTGKESTRAVGETTVEHKVEVFDSTGSLVKRWSDFGGATFVAVDNSSEPLEDPSACSPSGCFVYVTHVEPNPAEPAGDGLPQGVEKFNAMGEGVNFEPPVPEEYVSGNEIIGAPARPGECAPPPFSELQFSAFAEEKGPRAIAVDTRGDIFVIDEECALNEPAVLEYRASGEFVRAIRGFETPGIGGEHENDGYGGTLSGIAFDAASNHLIVAVRATFPGSGGGNEDRGVLDEFDTNSGRYLSQITAAPGNAPLRRPTTLTVDSEGDLYAADFETGAIDVYGPARLLPDLRLTEASERTSTSAVVAGAVDPEGLALSNCHFEYVTEAAFRENMQANGGSEAAGFTDLASGGQAPCTPAPGSIPSDTAFHAVQAELTGLFTGTTYRYRLLATTAGTQGGTGASGSLAFTAPAPPRVDSSSASNISSTFADLHAQVDPLGADTAYYFQYVPDANYHAAAENPYEAGETIPVPAEDIGAGGPTGGAAVSVSRQLGGLAPGTTYHFRVVAENHAGLTDAPDVTFTTLPAVVSGLPDGRGYELVTPASKDNAADMFAQAKEEGQRTFEKTADFALPSESGDALLLQTQAAFGSSPAAFNNDYVFSRTPAGWSFTSLTDSARGVQSVSVSAIDQTDFARVGLLDAVGSGGSQSGLQKLNLVGAPGGPYTTVSADPPVHKIISKELAAQTSIAGASHDLGRVVLAGTNHDLCPGAASQSEGSDVLCDWTGQALKLLNVDSSGALLGKCGAVLGQDPDVSGSARNAISADGSQAIFTAPDPHAPGEGEGCWLHFGPFNINAPQLYLRSGDTTIRVSKPTEPEVPDPCSSPSTLSTECAPAAYVGASEDGSKVFFVTRSKLTRDDVANEDLELYEYDTNTSTLTRISAGQSGDAAGDVWTVPAIASTGDAVYFEAFGALAPGASARAEGEKLVNLYRYDTATGATSYISTLSTRDAPHADISRWFNEMPVEVAPAPQKAVSFYTTPDGRYLLFGSSRELTEYSTASSSPGCQSIPATQGGSSEGHCVEIYSYEAQTGKPPLCVSCNPSGEPPTSDASFDRSALEMPTSEPLRTMSDDGSYVFFDTADPLVPQDTNDTLDVYEWHEGQVSLISSGTDPFPSYFLGSSAASVDGRKVEGANVFFGTHARLVSQDTNTGGDVYDARIGGGFPQVSSQTAACEGDACQNAPTVPIDSTPSSSTFFGAGNLLALPAAKPKKKPVKCKSSPKTQAKGKRQARVKKQSACSKGGTRKVKKTAKKVGRNGRTK